MSTRILVIDDVENIRTVLKMTLEFKGFEVVTADNGHEGLAAAAAGKFDLVFSDIAMPVMNGVEFCRRFRAEIDRTTPIIMLTAEGDELVAKAMAEGATATVSKPFEPIRLLGEIEKHLSA